jgi:hypothetical protein
MMGAHFTPSFDSPLAGDSASRPASVAETGRLPQGQCDERDGEPRGGARRTDYRGGSGNAYFCCSKG